MQTGIDATMRSIGFSTVHLMTSSMLGVRTHLDMDDREMRCDLSNSRLIPAARFVRSRYGAPAIGIRDGMIASLMSAA
jgi:hypothetical protein